MEERLVDEWARSIAHADAELATDFVAKQSDIGMLVQIIEHEADYKRRPDVIAACNKRMKELRSANKAQASA